MIKWCSLCSDDKIEARARAHTHTPTHTRPFNGPFSGTTQVSRCQKGKTNLDFLEARDSEWQWHQLGHMQVCTSLQTDNHSSTPPLSFLQAGCPTNSVKALKAKDKIEAVGDYSSSTLGGSYISAWTLTGPWPVCLSTGIKHTCPCARL